MRDKARFTLTPPLRRSVSFPSLSASEMNDKRFPQSQLKVGGVERGRERERHLGAGQGLEKDKKKEGVEWNKQRLHKHRTDRKSTH